MFQPSIMHPKFNPTWVRTHDGTFHVTETSAVTTRDRASVTSTVGVSKALEMHLHCFKLRHGIRNSILVSYGTLAYIYTLCKKASNHHANLPLKMYSFTLQPPGKHLETTGADDLTL